MQTRYVERSNNMAAAREKRGLDSSSGDDEGQPDRKRPALASVIVEALKVDSLQKLCSSLEPILRRVVSEEVERALAKLAPAKLTVRSSPKHIEGPDGGSLQLQFRSRLSLPLFTGGKVEGEQGAAIHIVLIDGNTGRVVTSGPESSVKLDVIVLEGIRVREAKTDAFTVKDHRGELYKKHYPPALTDEVWRLEKIGKDGSFHKRLNKARIYSVEDFLRLVVRDSQRLRTILGSGMSNKMWDVLVEHAKTCVLSGKLYIYYPEDEKNVGVVFNNIYELSGLIANGQYYSADSLSDNQKVYVDSLVKKAYDNWVHVIEYDGQSLLDFKQNQGIDALQNEVPSAQQEFLNSYDHQVTLPTISVPVPSEQPVMDSGLTVGGYNDDMAARFSMHQQNGNLSTPFQFDGNSLPSQNPLVHASQQIQVPGTDNLLVLAPPQTCTSGFQSFGISNLNSHNGTEDFFSEEEIRTRSHEMLENDDMQHLLRIFNMGGQGKAVVGWLKLKAALRWGIFVRKKAAERRAQLVELDDS
ncbi:hypothetical protein OIU78_000246 [Salix suchowensis]|nr:hypothetical protein OIU78_000246 [Salix suchowensis]